MKNYFNTKTIAGLGILTAIEVVLFYLNMIVRVGPFTLNLSLIAIALAAVLYGPIGGLFLGLVNGGLVFLTPDVNAFMSVNPVVTILMVLGKTGIAGLVAGFVFSPFKDSKLPRFFGVLLASCVIPVINTGIFVIGCLTIFSSLFQAGADAESVNLFVYLTTMVIGINFLVEFGVCAAFSTAIHEAYKAITHKFEK